MYKKAHNAIRANPEPLKKTKDPAKIKKKRWNLKKLSGKVRKQHVAQRKAAFIKGLETEAANS